MSKGKIALIVLGVLIVLGIIGSLTTPKSTPAAAPSSASPTAPPTSAAPPSPAAPAYGTLAPFTVNTGGYTIGFVARNGDVTAFTPKDKGLPGDCSVDAIAVARWSNKTDEWTATAEAPKDLIGSQPSSLMATFYGPFKGAYRFTADMHLAPEFHTSDYYRASFTKALVLHEDCSY
jgi:hypothetical protein